MAKKMNVEVTDANGNNVEKVQGAKKPENGQNPKPLREMSKEELDNLQREIGAILSENNRLRAENNNLKEYVNGANAALNDKNAATNISYCNMLVGIVNNSTVFEAYDHGDVVELAINKIAELLNSTEEEEVENGGTDKE